jgi:hypothetical protein
MLGPSGKLLSYLFFEHELTVNRVTLRFLLEKLLDRDAAILCGQFTRIGILLAFGLCSRLLRLRCHFVDPSLFAPGIITPESLDLLLDRLASSLWLIFLISI